MRFSVRMRRSEIRIPNALISPQRVDAGWKARKLRRENTAWGARAYRSSVTELDGWFEILILV